MFPQKAKWLIFHLPAHLWATSDCFPRSEALGTPQAGGASVFFIWVSPPPPPPGNTVLSGPPREGQGSGAPRGAEGRPRTSPAVGRSGQALKVLEGHTQCVENVCFSPDGTRLLSGSGDLSVKLWNFPSGVSKGEQTCHWRPAGRLVLGRNPPRIRGHSVIPAPPHHQNSVGTCCVQRVAQ